MPFEGEGGQLQNEIAQDQTLNEFLTELEDSAGGRLEVAIEEPVDENIVTCTELFSGRRGRPFSTSGVRDYVRRWKVIVKDVRYGPVAICKASCIPKPYSPYVGAGNFENDLAALLIDLDAVQEFEDDYTSWIVTGLYSTEVIESGPNTNVRLPDNELGPANNPEQERPVIEWDREVDNEAPQFDMDGKPFVNSAWQAFTPAPLLPVVHPVLVLTRNQLKVDEEKIKKFANALNDDTFLGHPAGTWQCYPPVGKLLYRGSIPYYRMTYRLRLETRTYLDADGNEKRRTWQPRFLDAGMYQLQKVLGFPLRNLPVPIMRGSQPVGQPVLLDGEGGQLFAEPDGSFKPVWREFRYYPTAPLHELFTN